MKVSEERKFANCSTRKLRRARNLYKFICAKRINRDADFAIIAAYRAIDSGLFSSSTQLSDVVFSFLRIAWSRFCVDSWLNSIKDHTEYGKTMHKARIIQSRVKRKYEGKPKIKLTKDLT